MYLSNFIKPEESSEKEVVYSYFSLSLLSLVLSSFSVLPTYIHDEANS